MPAESVYAIFEVKPELNAGTVKYAGEKAASVRRLRRTSAMIPHAGGTYPAKIPPRIIAGILTTKSGWAQPFGAPFLSALTRLNTDESLDMGCVLDAGSFAVIALTTNLTIQDHPKDVALVSFWLHLLESLQELGTVAALDFAEYRKSL